MFDLLAFAFQILAGVENFFGEMWRGIGQGDTRRGNRRGGKRSR